jgi:hypothetical protein
MSQRERTRKRYRSIGLESATHAKRIEHEYEYDLNKSASDTALLVQQIGTVANIRTETDTEGAAMVVMVEKQSLSGTSKIKITRSVTGLVYDLNEHVANTVNDDILGQVESIVNSIVSQISADHTNPVLHELTRDTPSDSMVPSQDYEGLDPQVKSAVTAIDNELVDPQNESPQPAKDSKVVDPQVKAAVPAIDNEVVDTQINSEAETQHSDRIESSTTNDVSEADYDDKPLMESNENALSSIISSHQTWPFVARPGNTNHAQDDNMSTFDPSIFNLSQSADDGSDSDDIYDEASAVPLARIINKRSKQPKPSSSIRAMRSEIVKTVVNKVSEQHTNANVANPVRLTRAPTSLDAQIFGYKFSDVVAFYDKKHPKQKSHGTPPKRKNRTCKAQWVDYTKITGPQTAATVRSMQRDELLFNVSNAAYRVIQVKIRAYRNGFEKSNVNSIEFEDNDDFIDFFEQLGITFSLSMEDHDPTENDYFDPHICVFMRAQTSIWEVREHRRRQKLKKAEAELCMPYWLIPVNASYKAPEREEDHDSRERPFIWPCEKLTGNYW